MIPDLKGQTLASVDIDFTLTLTTEQGWEVAVEGDQPADEELAAALHTAIGQPITLFNVQEGVLALDVGDARIRAEPDPTYEAWNIAGPDKQLVVCRPGGELAIWS